MSKLGIVEENSKPSLAYLPRKKFLTDFTLYSNAAPTSQMKFTLLPSVDRFLVPSTPLPLPTLPPHPLLP
jgi:hypothetical protein